MANDWVSGAIEGIEARQQIQLNDLTIQDESNKVASGKIALQQQQKIIQLMNQSTPGGRIEDNAAALDRLGEIHRQVGDLAGAETAFRTAMQMRQYDSEIAHRAHTEQLEDAKIMSNLLMGVNDPDSWRAANLQYSMITGKPSPFSQNGELAAFDPNKVAQYRQAFQTEKVKAETALTNEKIKTEKGKQRAQDTREKLDEEKLRDKKDREGNLKKVGDKSSLKEPSGGMISDALDQARKEYPTATTAELKKGARELAAAARTLMSQNPGMDEHSAVNKAFQMWAPQTFAGLKADKGNKGDYSRPVDLTPEYAKVASATTPEAKAAQKTQIARALRIGWYYTITDPKTGQPITVEWDGTQFVPRSKRLSAEDAARGE